MGDYYFVIWFNQSFLFLFLCHGITKTDISMELDFITMEAIFRNALCICMKETWT